MMSGWDFLLSTPVRRTLSWNWGARPEGYSTRPLRELEPDSASTSEKLIVGLLLFIFRRLRVVIKTMAYLRGSEHSAVSARKYFNTYSPPITY